jgi:hypothetical protein
VAERALVSIRRRVAEADRAAYDRTWHLLAEVVTRSSGHAWRFRSRQDDRERIEFLEFAEGADPRQTEEVHRLLRTLDTLSSGHVEEWVGG